MTATPEEPTAEPDDSYLVADEDSDFDPEDVADDDDTPAETGPDFVDKEVQDDGSE